MVIFNDEIDTLLRLVQKYFESYMVNCVLAYPNGQEENYQYLYLSVFQTSRNFDPWACGASHGVGPISVNWVELLTQLHAVGQIDTNRIGNKK